MDFGVRRGECFGNLELCPRGATYALWILIAPKPLTTPNRMYFLSSGGQSATTSHGIALYLVGMQSFKGVTMKLNTDFRMNKNNISRNKKNSMSLFSEIMNIFG